MSNETENELTVEKIQNFINYCDSMSHAQYVMAAAPPEHNEVLSQSNMELHKFLLSQLATKEDQIGESFNNNDRVGMENLSLRKQLATIERDTAEKCADIASEYDMDCFMSIRHHFNLGETPSK